ncbi:ceramide synthase 1 [Malurus melanocephalus]|uniref:ceramide synthase 1 n=1 Tax=Malurus melanocephalus TaxID=175006 RepID=UPI0025490AF2|nr:ceramide synthase 1 [Malurus melanocephalus]
MPPPEPMPGYGELLRRGYGSLAAAARGCGDCGWERARRSWAENAHLGWPEVLLCGICALAWTALRRACSRRLFRPFGEWCELQPRDAAKMPESAWKLLFYSVSWSYGAYLLFGTDYPFFHDPPSVFRGTGDGDPGMGTGVSRDGERGVPGFWFRLYWFPLKVLYATSHCSLQAVPDIPFYFFFNALLLVLTLMNIYWFLYIVLFVAKVLLGQMQEVNDVREYDGRALGTAVAFGTDGFWDSGGFWDPVKRDFEGSMCRKPMDLREKRRTL